MTETEAEVTARAPEEIRFFVRELIRLARVYTTLDDVEHYQTTRLTLPLRKGLRALGAALTRRGVLDEPMDIFFAQYAPLNAAIQADSAAEWRRFSDLVRQEKQAYSRHRRETPAWEWGKDIAQVAFEGSTLTGLAGSPGVASGPVYKVLGSGDFGKFPQGAVLVARTTNPAWTPLFYKASAVITESGGPLSHGAVTAREIGLPAVMSVRAALTALRDGERVTVDGSAGIIQRETSQ